LDATEGMPEGVITAGFVAKYLGTTLFLVMLILFVTKTGTISKNNKNRVTTPFLFQINCSI
jgi:hypothetical protein